MTAVKSETNNFWFILNLLSTVNAESRKIIEETSDSIFTIIALPKNGNKNYTREGYNYDNDNDNGNENEILTSTINNNLPSQQNSKNIPQ